MDAERFVAFDLETTGLVNPYIVSFAFIRSDGKSLASRVCPPVPIEPEATEVHGITNEDVVHERPFVHYSMKIEAFIAGHPLVCHNAAFDLPILDHELRMAGLPGISLDRPVYDTLEIERSIYPMDLESVYKRRLSWDMKGAHDAKADAQACLRIFTDQRRTHKEHVTPSQGYADHARKIKLNEQGDPCFAFGKYRGKPVGDYPDYASWMLTQDFPESTKEALRRIIAWDLPGT